MSKPAPERGSRERWRRPAWCLGRAGNGCSFGVPGAASGAGRGLPGQRIESGVRL